MPQKDCLRRRCSFAAYLLIFVMIIPRTATNENQSSAHYLPNAAFRSSTNNVERLQQILKGAGAGAGAGEINWPQPPTKTEKSDVKTEIAKLNTTYIYQNGWPALKRKLGAVTAVSFDRSGNVIIFHRVDRLWGQFTFNNSNHYQETFKGPIKENTVLALERTTGNLIYEWGKNIFYMPHGLTVDPEDNVWLTDVALHQVFKFSSHQSGHKLLLTLGTAFMPGAGKKKFCKPTSVAVLNNGDFFVADGYCNARILKYNKLGELILTWGQNSFAGASYEVAPRNYFAIPHALTLVPEQDLLCAADRENGRVQCFYAINGTFHSQYHSQIIGDRLFSMAYTPAAGGEFIIVNGPTAELGTPTDHYNEVHGYVMQMRTKQVTSKFGANNLEFSNPHDVAVTTDGNEVYVAELNPTRIHKFLHKSVSKPLTLSAAKSSLSQVGVGNQLAHTNGTLDGSTVAHTHRPGGTAILVATLMLLFAGLTFASALLFARRRKRGCLPFGTQNRRHAWEKPEGFKLGNLLDRGARSGGFEKLEQHASDEEQEPAANMLDNAQFA